MSTVDIKFCDLTMTKKTYKNYLSVQIYVKKKNAKELYNIYTHNIYLYIIRMDIY